MTLFLILKFINLNNAVSCSNKINDNFKCLDNDNGLKLILIYSYKNRYELLCYLYTDLLRLKFAKEINAV